MRKLKQEEQDSQLKLSSICNNISYEFIRFSLLCFLLILLVLLMCSSSIKQSYLVQLCTISNQSKNLISAIPFFNHLFFANIELSSFTHPNHLIRPFRIGLKSLANNHCEIKANKIQSVRKNCCFYQLIFACFCQVSQFLLALRLMQNLSQNLNRQHNIFC